MSFLWYYSYRTYSYSDSFKRVRCGTVPYKSYSKLFFKFGNCNFLWRGENWKKSEIISFILQYSTYCTILYWYGTVLLFFVLPPVVWYHYCSVLMEFSCCIWKLHKRMFVLASQVTPVICLVCSENFIKSQELVIPSNSWHSLWLFME